MHPVVSLARKLHQELKGEELEAALYFIREVSVGELLAIQELSLKVKDPRAVLRRLCEKGIIVRREGCYNLSEEVKRVLLEVREENRCRNLLEAGLLVSEKLERLLKPWRSC